jgi:hypothetical protein
LNNGIFEYSGGDVVYLFTRLRSVGFLSAFARQGESLPTCTIGRPFNEQINIELQAFGKQGGIKDVD